MNTEVWVAHSTKAWICLMKTQKSTPPTRPARVPSTPMAAPAMKKMRRTAPLPAPMVRRMAMSLVLFFTSMIKPVMMFIAAIATTNIRIRRITLRSTCQASKKLWFRSVQSVTMAPGPAALATLPRMLRARSGSASFTAMASTAWSRPKKSWACSSGM